MCWTPSACKTLTYAGVTHKQLACLQTCSQACDAQCYLLFDHSCVLHALHSAALGNGYITFMMLQCCDQPLTSFCGYMLRLSMVQSPTKVIGSDRSVMISVVQLCGVVSLASQLYSIAAVPCIATDIYRRNMSASPLSLTGIVCQRSPFGGVVGKQCLLHIAPAPHISTLQQTICLHVI